MRRLGFIPLHYGAEYLEAAIKSVSPCIDHLLILYTSIPSYGHNSGARCPEDEEQLKKIAYSCLGNISWFNITGDVHSEGEHRHMAIEYARLNGFDQIISFDSDEVWDTEVLFSAMEKASTMPFDRVKVSGWLHFWRGFNWVCTDGFLPVRIFNVNREMQKDEGIVEGKIFHFGYAQSEPIMRYKWSCHGHQNELRPRWMETKYINWVPGINAVHPVSENLWNPVEFNKEQLPAVLKNHVNFSKWMI